VQIYHVINFINYKQKKIKSQVNFLLLSKKYYTLYYKLYPLWVWHEEDLKKIVKLIDFNPSAKKSAGKL